MKKLLIALLLGLPAASFAQNQVVPFGASSAGGGGGLQPANNLSDVASTTTARANIFSNGIIFLNAFDTATSTTTLGSANDLVFSTGTILANTFTKRGQCVELECAARWSLGAPNNTFSISWSGINGARTQLGSITAGNTNTIGTENVRICMLGHASFVVKGAGQEGTTTATGATNAPGQTMAGLANWTAFDETVDNKFNCVCNDNGSAAGGKCAFEYFVGHMAYTQ